MNEVVIKKKKGEVVRFHTILHILVNWNEVIIKKGGRYLIYLIYKGNIGVCLSDKQGQGRARVGVVSLSDKQGQGRAARADTRSLFSVINRARQGRAARVDTRPLFSVTLAFTDRPSDDRVQIITVFTNYH